jgi:hypothetical protein
MSNTIDKIEKSIKDRITLYESELENLDADSKEALVIYLKIEELEYILTEIKLIRRTDNV